MRATLATLAERKRGAGGGACALAPPTGSGAGLGAERACGAHNHGGAEHGGNRGTHLFWQPPYVHQLLLLVLQHLGHLRHW